MRRLGLALVLVVAFSGLTSTDALAGKKPPRRGGSVHKAWPANRIAPKPKNKLAQWLAKQQVGPEASKKHKHSAHAATLASSSQAVLLIRSFDIPTSDAAHDRLA